MAKGYVAAKIRAHSKAKRNCGALRNCGTARPNRGHRRGRKNPMTLADLTRSGVGHEVTLADLVGTGTGKSGTKKRRTRKPDAEDQRLLGHDKGMGMGLSLLNSGHTATYIRAYADGMKEALTWQRHAMASYNPRRRRRTTKRRSR